MSTIKKATVSIKGMTALQQGREYGSSVPKDGNETSDRYEGRTWMNRAHIDGKGIVIHPAQAFKNALVSAARYTGEQIPGQGKKTWTAKVKSGVTVVGSYVEIGKKEDISKLRLFVPSNGKTGNSSRVWKSFPVIYNWECTVQFMILDDIITEDVFARILEAAGRFIGIGSWRPENGGENGRFTFSPDKIVWE